MAKQETQFKLNENLENLVKMSKGSADLSKRTEASYDFKLVDESRGFLKKIQKAGVGTQLSGDAMIGLSPYEFYDFTKVVDGEVKQKLEETISADENTYESTGSEYTWAIDPLDGTNNFVSGLPIFCASIALLRKNEVIAAAIYDVTRDELFYAQKNKGAFLNGKRIHVSSVDTFTKALLITGFYYSRGKEVLETLDAIKRFLFKRVIGLRRLGSAALDLCFVASGRATGYWEFELNPWDFAAGKLIVEEAGGKVTDSRGNKVNPCKKSFIVSSNAKIHNQMLSVINKSYK